MTNENAEGDAKSGTTLPDGTGRLTARVVESLVSRGDISALSAKERLDLYRQMCDGLGLDPTSQPFTFLRLNGKDVLYATRGATDQLAAIHRLDREIIDGPKIIDIAGTKVVVCTCRVRHPNGRVETSIGSVEMKDPGLVFMKAETKAKRRATLSILGLGMLDETGEQDPAPARRKAPVTDPPRAPAGGDGDAGAAGAAGAHAVTLRDFLEDVAKIGGVTDAVDLWIRYRQELPRLEMAEREQAWNALVTKTGEVAQIRNAKAVLKKGIENAIAKKPEPEPPGGGGRPVPAADGPAAATAAMPPVPPPQGATGTKACVEFVTEAGEVLADPQDMRQHLAACIRPSDVCAAYLHGRRQGHAGFVELCVERYMAVRRIDEGRATRELEQWYEGEKSRAA